MKKIKVAVIGAGDRGLDYGEYALNHTHEVEIVAVAEPNLERINRYQELHDIHDAMCFTSWEELLTQPKLADALLICTQDKMHYEPTIKALKKGYHVLVEKPMSTDPNECFSLVEAAKKYGKIVSTCHVLRYTDFFKTLKCLLNEGKIGKLISIQHSENVGYYHYAHSYVRGNWSKVANSSPMILAKCCHDMDIILWLVGYDCDRISSFGSLTHFKRENAPQGAPLRCLDGCPHENECPYYAPKLYLTSNTNWPTSVISEDTSLSARTRALKLGPYGRCVYHCDNDVVDHQVVNLVFRNGVTASFNMCAFTPNISRTIKLMGTEGQIKGDLKKNEIEVTNFNSGTKELIYLKVPDSGHAGGDFGIMRNFIRLIQNNRFDIGINTLEQASQSHLMALAAEKSRLEQRVIKMHEYVSSLSNLLGGK